MLRYSFTCFSIMKSLSLDRKIQKRGSVISLKNDSLKYLHALYQSLFTLSDSQIEQKKCQKHYHQ